MKKLFLFLSLIFVFSFSFASNCGSQVEIGADCNVMVQPFDSNSNRCTSNCKCNEFLYNPSYAKVIDNNAMVWDSIRASFWLDTNALLNVSGEWIVDINCFALDINRSISGQIYVVDRDTNHLLHDINADINLMPNRIWQNGLRTLTDYNMSTFPAYLWAYSNRTLTDYNMANFPAYLWGYSTRSLTDYNMATLPDFIWDFSSRTLTDYNQSLMFSYLEDINNSGGGGITASDVWNYATKTLTDYNMSTLPDYIWGFSPRELTDYNQSLMFTYLNDLNQTCSGGGGGLTASQVWGYSPRTLTGNTSEINLLYSNLEKENAYRYCAVDDIGCLNEQQGKNPILDQNTVSYAKQQEAPNFFGIEVNLTNIFIVVVVLIIVIAVGWVGIGKG